MFLDLFISDGNDLAWGLAVMVAIGMVVLPILLLGWLVKVALAKSADWVWVLLSFVVLLVLLFSALNRS
jgi:hypothetical protein